MVKSRSAIRRTTRQAQREVAKPQAPSLADERQLVARKKRRTTVKRKKASIRSYSAATLKILFGLSGNQCAFPGCTHEIISRGTNLSKAAAVGHVSHIYAAADNGPRGKPGLTVEERSAPENLILFCAHHHSIVDRQWESYPASTLMQWKKVHEAKATSGTAEAIKRGEELQKHAFLEQMSDEQIEAALARLRQGRFLAGFRTQDEALVLATQVERSRFSGGSDQARALALAWCARLLSQESSGDKAKELVAKSRALAITPEATIAEAFIAARTDMTAALSALAELESAAARSAALRIVGNKDGPQAALDWVNKSGLTSESFDPEGKLTFASYALTAGDWQGAWSASAKVTESDYATCPALLHPVAMARLLKAVPEEARPVVLNQVPFDAASFPLGSRSEHLAERREARKLFARLSEFAESIGLRAAADIASDYALWLALRDPDEHDSAMSELRVTMGESEMPLRRINLALRFGLRLDIGALESKIDESQVLSGKGTADEAFARLSIALAQGSAKGTAEYIDRHRRLLYDHLQKSSVQGLEIEALARAGLVATAQEKLGEAIREGLPEADSDLLRGIIAEASGADPIAERRAAYEATKDLRSLLNLVEALADAGLWQDLLPYAEKLYQHNPSVESFERIAQSLNALGRYDALYELLIKNDVLVAQSEGLGLLWAWTLYREGDFVQATGALRKLRNQGSRGARTLRINIAIASGGWDQLLAYCNELWASRKTNDAADLLQAAELSIAVNGPHSRDLLIEATDRAPNDASVLATAYFLATSAGYEQSDVVGRWLARAAELSGDSGPLKAMTLREIVEQKPAWDQRTEQVWRNLRTGSIPVFAAAQILNRSLLDLYLVPALTNPSEADVRKRTIVFAYSGARLSSKFEVPPARLGLDLAAIVTLARLEILERVTERFEIVIPHSTLGWLFQERQRARFHQPSRIQDARQLKRLISDGVIKALRPKPSSDVNLGRQVGYELAALLSMARTNFEGGVNTLVVRSPPIYRPGSLMDEQANIAGYEQYLCSCFAVVDRLKAKGALTRQEEQTARAYLTLHERPWPDEMSIGDGTEVCLDGLSISHLRAAGVLDKLRAVGVPVHIEESVNNEADALLAIESVTGMQLEIIEQIRKTLAQGIVSGRVRAVRTKADTDDEDIFKLHPTYRALGLVDKVDAIVIDDRFINRHSTVTLGRETIPLLCTLDIIEMLREMEILTPGDVYAARTTLRRSGYQLVPLSIDELAHYLSNTTIQEGRLLEIAELRAVRESLQRARMASLVQVPVETPFLTRTLSAYTQAIRDSWPLSTSSEEREGRANYLLAQMDVRKWAAAALPGNERGFALFGPGSYAMQLASPLATTDRAVRDNYYDWVTTRILAPLAETQPQVYRWIVDRLRELVIGVMEDALRDVETSRQ